MSIEAFEPAPQTPRDVVDRIQTTSESAIHRLNPPAEHAVPIDKSHFKRLDRRFLSSNRFLGARY
jgi:hypothetical protein